MASWRLLSKSDAFPFAATFGDVLLEGFADFYGKFASIFVGEFTGSGH